MENMPHGAPPQAPPEYYYNGFMPQLNGMHIPAQQEYKMYDRNLIGYK